MGVAEGREGGVGRGVAAGMHMWGIDVPPRLPGLFRLARSPGTACLTPWQASLTRLASGWKRNVCHQRIMSAGVV